MVTDDVKYFIGCLRVNDTTKYATCPELYAAFNNYCNRSELYTSVGCRQFTNFIVNSGHYTTTINRKIRCVVGVSHSKARKITRSDTLFESQSYNGGNRTAPHLHSFENHLLNKKCTVNTVDVESVHSDVGQSWKSCNFDRISPDENPRCVNGNVATAHTLQCVPSNVPQTVDSRIYDKIQVVTTPQCMIRNRIVSDTALLLGTDRCRINTR